MGAFSGLKDASRGFSSNPIRAGRYAVRIDGCDFFEARAGEKWKNTLTVLAVEDGGEKPHKVGETVHTFFNCKAGKEGKEIFQRNLKSFMAGVLDVGDEEIGEDEATVASSDDSPLKGLVTIVTVRMQASKDKVDEQGNPRMYPVYGWDASLEPEQIEELLGEEGMAKFFPNGFGE